MSKKQVDTTSCRSCAQRLPSPLWVLRDMPKSAQNFPLPGESYSDNPVDLRICQCDWCGLVQLANGPVPYFREVIRASGFSSEMSAFREKQFSNFVKRFDLDGHRGLEIGCGKGEYLEILRAQGLRMSGIEFSPQSVQRCTEKGFDVVEGFVDGPDTIIREEKFSACFMFNFLEHLPNPGSTLRGIAANLVEGAVGLFEVPNFEMIVRENMFTEFCTDHLMYFTESTFTQLLARNGFDVLESNSIWDNYILSVLVKKRLPIPIEGFAAAQSALNDSLSLFLNQFSGEKIAVWGAGHQALAVMAACGMSDNICYVIDSATFKQKRCTPATHLPIVSPDALETDPPRAILVMGAGYSDEIVDFINKRHPGRFMVAVLRGQSIVPIH